MSRRVMITGGFGFIGSNLVRYWVKKYPQDRIIVLDCMTYASREQYVYEAIEYRDSLTKIGVGTPYNFEHVYCDIRNAEETRRSIRLTRPDHIIHLAAESHVCRSIDGPRVFMETNIMGTFNLVESFRRLWQHDETKKHRFLHVSTDEVYGELSLKEGLHPDDPRREEKFCETYPYGPRSPYAASKAASDHIVQSYNHTYGINTVITACSNNFGPNQHEEKLIPKTILSFLSRKPATIYGDGRQVRDWIHVSDHCYALDKVFHNGETGFKFCIGGDNEMSNMEIVSSIHNNMVDMGLIDKDKSNKVDVLMTDSRPTDDKRYAIDSSLVKTLGWAPRPDAFKENLRSTILWYLERVKQ